MFGKIISAKIKQRMMRQQSQIKQLVQEPNRSTLSGFMLRRFHTYPNPHFPTSDHKLVCKTLDLSFTLKKHEPSQSTTFKYSHFLTFLLHLQLYYLQNSHLFILVWLQITGLCFQRDRGVLQNQSVQDTLNTGASKSRRA